MKGSIGFAKNVTRYYVAWYDEIAGRTRKIWHYKGLHMRSIDLAEKLLAAMQGDVENGVFLIEKYIRNVHDVVPYLRKWLESIKGTLSPGTQKDYRNSIENHLVPFFQTKTIQLHEIQYDTLMELLGTIARDGKGKLNVMYCLHACLDYAWRSQRIPSIPPFPKKKAYNIVEPPIEWLREIRQKAIIEAIPLEDQPIFWWLKYYLRRPGEAMALHKEDFKDGVFTVKRGFSAKQEIERTKTGEIHLLPILPELVPYIEIEQEKQKQHGVISPYFFVYTQGKKEGKHYTNGVLNAIWKKACKKAGETIGLYSGTKHSSCSQLINEYGYSIHEVQMATDHARLESAKKYAKIEMSARQAILEKKVVHLKDACTILERNSKGNIQ